MKKQLLLIFIGILLAFSVWWFISPNISATQSEIQITPTSIATQEKISETSLQTIEFGKPVEVYIPKLNIRTTVEHVGEDQQGRMDVPKDDMNVAWFEPGYTPGKKGNAVLAGHYDTKSGGPAVFYSLPKLVPGDEVHVTDDAGNTLTFVVVDSATYPDADFPIQTVFGKSEKPRLNLITCQGDFDEESKNYSDRLVVFTELKQ